MGWKISTVDNKYQIIYGSNANYADTKNDISYLTITSNKLFGINNANPSSNYLLDINGITHINSNLYVDGNIYASNNVITSNIIGYTTGNSNILQINNTYTNDYSNNIVEIYGKTSLYGNVYITRDANIINNDTSHLLNIRGSLKASSIWGDGYNITNLNANNFLEGKLPVSRGGTGLNNIVQNQLLYGQIDNIDGVVKMAQSINFKIEDIYIRANFKAEDITSGKLSVKQGGTGLTFCDKGSILYGGNTPTGALEASPFETSIDFAYDSTNTLLRVSNLIIEKELNFNSFKIKDSVSRIYRDLLPRDVGVLDATCNIAGIVKLSTDFRVEADGKLKINASTITATNNLWGVGINDSIYYPKEGIPNTFLGINTLRPMHALDVNGIINTSNGGFSIDGVSLDTQIDSKVAAAQTSYAQLLFANIDITNETNIGGSIIPSVLNDNQAILNRTNDINPWKIKTTITGERSTEISKTLEIDFINTNKLSIINSTDTVDSAIFSISTKTPNNIVTRKLIFTHGGNLRIAQDNNIPAQKLEVGGNIYATGHIRSYYSDNRLKTFTSNITNSLDIIDNLNGFYYVPNEKALQLGFEYDNEIGLSAQEVRNVIPEIVKIAPFDTTKINGNITSKSGEEYLTICYERLGAVFVEAIKELRKENKILKDEINVIKKDLDNIKKIIYLS